MAQVKQIKRHNLIAGAGSKKGGGRRPVEQDDTVRATQYIQVIDVLGEGPIKGIVPNAQGDVRAGIYFEDTPLISENGLENIRVHAIEWRTGEPNQLPLKGFAEAKQHIPVGAQVLKEGSGSVTRTLNNPNANSVIVTMMFPALFHQNKDNGDISGTEVTYEILVQTRGGGFQSKGIHTCKEKFSSTFMREHRIELEGSGPWDIRVKRYTDDSRKSELQNDTYFESMTAIIDSKLTYANTAVIGLGGHAEDFSQVPRRAYLCDGLIISVPSNYNPYTREYTGTWDGTFKQEWSNNPVWVLYDLVTSNRYGLGRYIPKELVDKWTLYNAGQYCDQMVDDGYGRLEPRYTCNAYIFNDEDAYALVQSLASVLSSIVYWGAGGIQLVQDRPGDVDAIFTNANVIDGRFTYKGTSLRGRHTVAMVSWNDPDDLYKPKVEYVQDDEAVAKWGIISTQVAAVGCTSRGQAHRFGRRLLYTEQYETETVSFKTGLEGFFLNPGSLILTADAARSGTRLGGRVVSATTTHVTLDKAVKLDTNKTYYLSVVSPSGRVVGGDVMTLGGGETDVISLRSALAEAPQEQSVWVLHTSEYRHKSWRVISVEVVDKAQVQVTALSYRADKYDAIDKGLKLEPLRHTGQRTQPAQPTDLNLLVAMKELDGLVTSIHGTLSWAGNASTYVVRYRHDHDAWQSTEVSGDSPKLELPNLQIGTYQFSVTPYSALGIPGVPGTLEYEVTPQAVKLPAVTGLMLEGRFNGETAKFKWDSVKGATGYTVRVIVGGQVKREVAVGDALRFDYSAEDMRADGGPWRGFDFSVKATGKWGSESDWATITVGNRQAGALVSLEVTAGMRVGYVNVTAPPEDDIVGLVVWCSADPACPPIDANKVYDGPVGMVTISKLSDGSLLVPGTRYFVRAAAYDTFGRDNLNASTATPFTPLLVDIGPNTITETEIKNDSISTPKLRANAVRAHNIAANEIVGMHIAANTITGEHIRAGSVNATHITSGLGSGNLLPNAAFVETYTDSGGRPVPVGYEYHTSRTSRSDYNIAINVAGAAWHPFGVDALAIHQVNAAGAGNSEAYIDTNSPTVPVVAGAYYEASVYSAAHRCSVTMYIAFKDSQGAWIHSVGTVWNAEEKSGGTRLDGYYRHFVVARAPEGAVSAYVALRKRATLPGRADSYGFFLRPYLGVATGPQQLQPSPWAAPGIGTQIHGGAIRTGTVAADRLSVDTLSAITANLGYCTAGEVHGGKFHGGAFNGNYAWPASGGGFHLSEHGLLMGNANTGGYFQLNSNGDMHTPGMTLVGGTLTINQLRVIKSSNIARDAISRHFRASSNITPPMLTVTAHEECSVVIYYGMYPRTGSGTYAGSMQLVLRSGGSPLHSADKVLSRWTSGGSGSSTDHYSVTAAGMLVGSVPRGVYTLNILEAGYIEVLLVFR